MGGPGVTSGLADGKVRKRSGHSIAGGSGHGRTVEAKGPKVVVILKAVPHYRRPFLDLLRERLQGKGIVLEVLFGDVARSEADRQHTVDLPWGIHIHNRVLSLGARKLYWQPVFSHLVDADLVVVMQESKLLVNYVLMAARRWLGYRLAFWGHGANLQPRRRHPLGEAIKRVLSRRADWWFAYTAGSARIVAAMGYPLERITVVNNAIDVDALVRAREGITPAELASLRKELGLPTKNVALFAGSLYEPKRIPFLIEACDGVRARVPDFHLLVVGAGPDEAVIRRAMSERPWVHYVGPKLGILHVPYFMLSRLLLIPGMVGLNVLDAFAMEVPLVTTAVEGHSPEIEYLQDGVNGIIVPDPEDPSQYAAKVAELLKTDEELQWLRQGCRVARELYTLERMVDNFVKGIETCLSI